MKLSVPIIRILSFVPYIPFKMEGVTCENGIEKT